MLAKYQCKYSLCLISEQELSPFLQELKRAHPQVEIEYLSSLGTIQVLFQGSSPVDALGEALKNRFPTFFFKEDRIEDALHNEFILRKKTLCLGESCTGGAIAAKLTAIPEASRYFLGSIVAYSNTWKERFLQVSTTTLKEKGAVSREVVSEMVKGLFSETDADFAAAVSGIAGPGGGTKEKPVGTICIALGERGQKIDVGVIHAPKSRLEAIDLSVYLTLGALWRRLVHKTATFS